MEWEVGFDEDELLVAGVLASLSDSILQAESSRVSRPQPSWGVRKKRSAISAAQSPPPLDSVGLPPAAALEEQGAAAAAVPAKAEVDSPASPFSFPRSESDEKLTNRCKGTSRKRREELLQILMDCTKRRDFLRGEIEAVRLHYESLKSFNSELTSRKQKVLVRHEIEAPPQPLVISHTTTTNSPLLNPTLTLEIGRHDAVPDPHQTSFPVLYQQPSVSDSAAAGTSQHHDPEVKTVPCGSPPAYVLDLNVPAWEEDLSLCIVPDERTRAADARKRRRELLRMKGNNYAASRRKMVMLR